MILQTSHPVPFAIPEAWIPWLFYLIVVAGAAAIYCLLPRGRGGLGNLGLLGALIGMAALAGLIVWMLLLQKTRTYMPIENPLRGSFFYLFAAIALASAVMVVVHPRPIYSALYFVLTVLAVGGLLLLLFAEFLAVALVLIYAGAILVTYVFVIMLARQSGEPAGPPARQSGEGDRAGPLAYDLRPRHPLAGVLAGFLLLAAIGGPLCDRANWYTGMGQLAQQQADAVPAGSAAAMGHELYRGHMLAIELAGVLLVVAIVGAVAVARKRITRDDVLPGTQEEPNDG